MQWRDRRILVVQPHMDDAALSVGGLLRRTAGANDMTLVTVFGRSRWSLDRAERCAEAITLRRREEDARYARMIGARPIIQDAPDSSLRGYDAVTERQGRSESLEALRAIRALLGGHVSALRPDICLTPTGIGGHVDHLMTRDAIVRCAGPATRIMFYEDLPYAALAPWTPPASATSPRERLWVAAAGGDLSNSS